MVPVPKTLSCEAQAKEVNNGDFQILFERCLKLKQYREKCRFQLFTANAIARGWMRHPWLGGLARHLPDRL